MFLTRRYNKKAGWGINMLYGIKVKGMLQSTVSESMVLFIFKLSSEGIVLLRTPHQGLSS